MARQPQRATVRPVDVPPGGFTTAPPPKPKCETCRFWVYQGQSAKGPAGQCQWQPPDVLTPTLTEWGPLLIHGLTLATQGCSRHEPQPGDRPATTTTEQQR